MLVHTEQGQDQGVELGELELSPHGTLLSRPPEHVLHSPEEMLPVVGDVGEDRPQTPHVSRGADVRIVSSEDLGSQVADSPTTRGGVLVQGGGGLG